MANTSFSLNIEFREDANHLPEIILTLRSHRQGAQTLYEIESWLTQVAQVDVQRFALIHQELQQDLAEPQFGPGQRTK
jgi:hypothetical protein